MAADVTSLVRIMNGYKDDQNESNGGGKSTVPMTRDLLGGCSSTLDSKELDLDLQVPTGWEKRLDLTVILLRFLSVSLITFFFSFLGKLLNIFLLTKRTMLGLNHVTQFVMFNCLALILCICGITVIHRLVNFFLYPNLCCFLIRFKGKILQLCLSLRKGLIIVVILI